jgi:DNA-binding NarL/FixJ family response regulator
VDQRFIEEAKEIGARAYVAKTKAGEALVEAIEAAVIGGRLCFDGVIGAAR